MSVIGENIKKYRLLRGLSQTELGDLIGETKQTIWKYESGTVTNIPLPKVEAISEALHVGPCVLSGWEKENQPISELDEDRVKLFNLITQLPKDQLRMLEAQIQVYLQNQEDPDA